MYTDKAINVTKLRAGYAGSIIVDEVSTHIPKGAITALIGANGCGKSTLLKCIAGVLTPSVGEVTVCGKNVVDYKRRELAQRMSLLPQSPVAPEGLCVRELVRFGRHPHHGLLARFNQDDDEAVEQAIDAAGLSELADRQLDSLSGGQRQRAWIAMSLAQQAEIMLLDEPTTYLDIQNQTEVLRLLRRLNRDSGVTIAMVVHDLNQAARYADHIIALCGGQVAASGAPSEVLTEELVADVFGLEAKVVPNPLDGTPLCLPVD